MGTANSRAGQEDEMSPDVEMFRGDVPSTLEDAENLLVQTPEEVEKSITERGANVKLSPAVLRWTHGGHKVYVTGTFNNWKSKIPLTKSSEDFYCILNIPDGTHQYKFIVDNEWKTDPNQQSSVDVNGQIINYIESAGFDRILNPETERSSSPEGEEYAQKEEQFEENRKNPPLLPPHLKYTPLNFINHKNFHSPAVLPAPHHVTLGHVYYSKRENVMAIGFTHRYENKFTTIMLYKPLTSSRETEMMELMEDSF